MQLSEEYFKRHSIAVPLVQHVDQGTILFRSADPKTGNDTVKWIKGTITFRPDNSHPGTYNVCLSQPMHNTGERGERGSSSFSNIENNQIEWDAYEEHLLGWINKKLPAQVANLRVIKDPKEVELTAWEIFVYNYDSSLVRYAADANLFKSLDLDLTFDERYNGYSELMTKFQREASNFYELWVRDVKKNTVDKYAYWLADLIGANSAA